MKRKPTTKQTVKAELIRLVRAELIQAREGEYDFIVDTARGRAVGAIYLAYRSEVINEAEYDVLHDLAQSTHERGFELIYGAPPYTGRERAKAWRAASKAAA